MILMKRNILLIVLDAARYDIFTEEISPYIWGLAEEGVRFTNYYSTASWSLPAHASMFTGLHVREHGVEYQNMMLHPQVPTLAEELKREGYQTVGFCNNPWVSPATGLDRGFDQFYGIWHKAFLGKMASQRFSQKTKSRVKAVMEFARYRDYVDSGASRTLKKIKGWMKKEYHEDNPYFMFINFMETHGKLKPPEPYRSRFYRGLMPWDKLEQDFRKTISGEIELCSDEWKWIRQLQMGEMAYIDSQMKELIEGILYDTDPMIFIVSDHGDLFGEEDCFLGTWAGHKYSLHPTLLHVPFMIAGSSHANNPIFEGLVQHNDLFSMILDVGVMGWVRYPSRKAFGFAEHTNPKLFIEQFQESVKPLSDSTYIDKLLQNLIAIFDTEGNQLTMSDKYGKHSNMPSIASWESMIEPWKSKRKAPPPPTGIELEFDEAEKLMLNLGLF